MAIKVKTKNNKNPDHWEVSPVFEVIEKYICIFEAVNSRGDSEKQKP